MNLWIELDKKNLQWNLKQIRHRLKDSVFTPVLKCNGYGLGGKRITRALEEENIAVIHEDSATSWNRNESEEMEYITHALLGLTPFSPMSLQGGFVPRPVYSLKACVIMVKKIPAGAEIGWNNEKKIPHDTLFATIPVGYADGYPPNVERRAQVLIQGKRFDVKGFISANHTTIDITGCPHIKIGDEVVLVGVQGNETVSHQQLARFSKRGNIRLAVMWNPSIPRLMVPPAINGKPKGGGKKKESLSRRFELNRQNLAWNVAEIRRRTANTPIMAVVKCNAYGHGILEIANELVKHGITDFAVVKVEEAMILTEHRVPGTILNLGAFSPGEAVQLVKHDIFQSVFSSAVDTLSTEAVRQGKTAHVHIKIDTGLGRVGVAMEDAPAYIRRVAELPGIKIAGVFTVLTRFEGIPAQLRRFSDICDDAQKENISLGIRHAAASGDVADGPFEAYLDMVRPGLCLYGLSPMANMNLKPVLRITSRVVKIKASGGKTFAVVPVGFGHGYPWNETGDLTVLIMGRHCRVCEDMALDYMTVDITGIKNITVGDEVVLLGKQDSAEITCRKLSAAGKQTVYRTPVYLNPCD